jgi:hypothetical protein
VEAIVIMVSLVQVMVETVPVGRLKTIKGMSPIFVTLIKASPLFLDLEIRIKKSLPLSQ